MFTGQFYDSEIDEYYLRARQYDPYIGRFTSRDPVKGYFREPMTLHAYLYCLNDPVNRTDPTGEFLGLIWGQTIMAKMRAKMAGAALAAKLGLDRFVTTLNLKSVWLEFQMIKSDTAFMAAQGMARVHNLFANVAWYGEKALIAAHEAIANWTNLTTYKEQMAFINGLLGPGSPGLPQDPATGAGAAIYELADKLHDEYSSDWDSD